MTSAAPYDLIASIYDRHWGDEFAEFAKEAVREHLSGPLPADGAVLDLCCGTGLLLRHLDALGYRAFGVDESSKMLEIARGNAPRAQLQQADMAEFRWQVRFNAVLSLYNSVNHARSLEHLRLTLVNAAGHLASPGFLLFDYVLPEAFEQAWECSEKVNTQEGPCEVRYFHEPDSGYATCQIGSSSRIRQALFESSEIRAALFSAGFAVLSETSMTGPNPVRGRRLVLAAKF